MNSSQSDFRSLLARVEKLETQNRRWRLVNALLLLSGGSIVLMGAKPADRLEPPVVRAASVEAQEFILKDETGHVYARLSLSPSVPGMRHHNGRTYIFPGQTFPGEAALQFYDDKGDVLWTAPSNAQLLPVK